MSTTHLVPPARRVLVAAIAGVLLAACGADSTATAPAPSASSEAAASTDAPAPTSSGSTAAAATSSSEPATSPGPTPSGSATTGDVDASHAPSGPDGRYAVGDTYTDGEFVVTYEGLAAVPLEDGGDHADGECYIVLASLETVPDTPRLASGGTISFAPSLDPIFAGEADTEQSNEYFNCAVGPVQDQGYTQSSVTDVGPGETAPVWIDAIWVSPERADTLEAFRLFGMDDIAFTTEVTQDLTTEG